LAHRSVEHFLPQYESVRRWKDRRMKLQMPLFPGYIFVRAAFRDRVQILQVPGIARLVAFNGLPCPVPDLEIEAMQLCVRRNAYLEPHPYVKIGRRVRVKYGPLAGVEGLVVRKKNSVRFVISLDLIQRSVAVEIDSADLVWI